MLFCCKGDYRISLASACIQQGDSGNVHVITQNEWTKWTSACRWVTFLTSCRRLGVLHCWFWKMWVHCCNMSRTGLAIWRWRGRSEKRHMKKEEKWKCIYEKQRATQVSGMRYCVDGLRDAAKSVWQCLVFALVIPKNIYTVFQTCIVLYTRLLLASHSFKSFFCACYQVFY